MGLADDGKRSDSLESRWTLHIVVVRLYLFRKRGGSLREGVDSGLVLAKGLRMTGSAFRCWTLQILCFSERRMGEGPEGGGSNYRV